MSMKKLLAVALLVFASGTFAANPALNPNHPDTYTVVKGDTLWDISGRFLRDPWRWPDVWHVNPQVKNPHLIYPGDVLALTYDANGKPVIKRIKRGRPTVKLSPGLRSEKLHRAIPTIPLDAIQQFLSRPLVVSEQEINESPYIVETAGEHVVVGAGDKIYVRGLKDNKSAKYSIYRPGQVYTNPDVSEDEKEPEVLGHEAIFVGEGQLTYFRQDEEVSTLAITSSTREAKRGDLIFPINDDDYNEQFLPHAPANEVEGTIIAVFDGVTQIGQHNTVVINKGAREGMEVGHVLTVFRRGETISDVVTENIRDDVVKLPDEQAGTVLVYRVAEKVSFALVMEATRAMHVFDAVRKPTDY